MPQKATAAKFSARPGPLDSAHGDLSINHIKIFCHILTPPGRPPSYHKRQVFSLFFTHGGLSQRLLAAVAGAADARARERRRRRPAPGRRGCAAAAGGAQQRRRRRAAEAAALRESERCVGTRHTRVSWRVEAKGEAERAEARSWRGARVGGTMHSTIPSLAHLSAASSAS